MSRALASGALARLVGYFSVRPDDTPHFRALMRNTGLTARSLQVELDRLERLDLVNREAMPNGRVRIRASGRPAAWVPFRALVRAYGRPADLLRFALTDLAGISAAFIFGSFASGAADNDSDVDLFVIAEPSDGDDARALERTLAQRTVEASLAIGRDVNPVVVTTSQLAEKLAHGAVFYENVLAGPKQWVIGDADRLRAVRRLARTMAKVIA